MLAVPHTEKTASESFAPYLKSSKQIPTHPSTIQTVMVQRDDELSSISIPDQLESHVVPKEKEIQHLQSNSVAAQSSEPTDTSCKILSRIITKEDRNSYLQI